jgi:Fusaric acid resistance protein family
LDAYERQADSIAPELDRYADRSRRAAALWVATLGFGVSRALRRLLARARQPLLGWDLSAAIVCKPQLGASLRKGMVSYDNVVGAAMIVVLIALFPQDRIGFLLLLAVWGGICAFAATARRNFASYSAALAGYTAAIIAADTLGATGASPLGRSLRFRQSCRCRNLSMRNGQWRRKKAARANEPSLALRRGQRKIWEITSVCADRAEGIRTSDLHSAGTRALDRSSLPFLRGSSAPSATARAWP